MCIKVFEFEDPEAAEAFIESNPVDLVLSDAYMLGNRDGLEFARAARHRFPSISIIIVSANVGEQKVKDIGQLIFKPYDPATVARMIGEILGAQMQPISGLLQAS
jgi:CheY-like chemotaxis protein